MDLIRLVTQLTGCSIYLDKVACRSFAKRRDDPAESRRSCLCLLIRSRAMLAASLTRPIPVDCIYQKRVEVVGFVFGDSIPRGIVYDSFMIHITAILDNDILRPRIEFDRTSEKVK